MGPPLNPPLQHNFISIVTTDYKPEYLSGIEGEWNSDSNDIPAVEDKRPSPPLPKFLWGSFLRKF